MSAGFVPGPNDPFGLGTDIALLGDLNPVWGTVSSFTNLSYALARRFRAQLASLFYDLGYGEDITDMVNQAFTPAAVSQKAQALSNQALLDERVQTCRVSLVLTPQTGQLAIAVTGTIPTGQAFTFIMAATSMNVALLAVNGQPVQQPATAAAAATGSTTVIIQGGSSEPGPAGPPGPAGSAQLTFNLNPNGYGDNSGAEVVVDQIEANLGALGGTVTIELVAAALSQSGTAAIRLRLGGSDNVADGTIVATLSPSTSSFVASNNNSTIANPGSLQRLKLTIQSSGAGQDALVQRGGSITIR